MLGELPLVPDDPDGDCIGLFEPGELFDHLNVVSHLDLPCRRTFIVTELRRCQQKK